MTNVTAAGQPRTLMRRSVAEDSEDVTDNGRRPRADFRCGGGVRGMAALVRASATEESFRRAADSELADAQPLPGNAFKVPLARNLIVRCLLDLLEKPEDARP